MSRVSLRCGAVAVALAASAAVLAAAPSAAPPAPSLDVGRVSLRTDTERPQLVVTVAPDAYVSFGRQSMSSIPKPEPKPESVPNKAAATAAVTVAGAKLAEPLAHIERTSPFGQRTSPITGDPTEFHSGQDFGAPCGTPVTAAAEGTVSFAQWHPYGGGNRVEITHGNGLVTTYNHLESSSVQPGQKLNRGDVLGKTGTTGSSTGCHLHFEVVLNGTHVDPLSWL